MTLSQIAIDLEQSAPSRFLREGALTIPLLQSVHILAVALVVSGAMLVALHTWGWLPHSAPVAGWNERLWRRKLWALPVLVVTGALLVQAEPTRELPNLAFQAKIAMLLPVLGFALWLTRRLSAPYARVLSALALLGWVVLVALGRWIAYA